MAGFPESFRIGAGSDRLSDLERGDRHSRVCRIRLGPRLIKRGDGTWRRRRSRMRGVHDLTMGRFLN